MAKSLSSFQNKISKYVENLIAGNSLPATFRGLASLFMSQHKNFECAMMLECIHRFDANPEWFYKAGDAINLDLDNGKTSLGFYLRYLMESNPEFYNKLKNVAFNQGMDFAEFASFSSKDEKSSFELAKLTARCKAILCLVKLYLDDKNYQEIMSLKSSYDILFKETCDYMVQEEVGNITSYSDLISYQKCVSEYLSQVKHHNDINNYAIELDSDNEIAYLNIIEDYLTYDNHNQAIDFYNNRYVKHFKSQNEESVVNLCWFLADKYYHLGDYFNSVKCQQCAINIELSKK